MRARFSLLITLAPFVALGCAGGPRAGAQGAAKSDGLGDIPLVSVEGRAATLAAVLGHRPALVSFWAPWCEPCVRELPALERLSRALASCGAAVVGVAVGEKPGAVGDFCRARGLTYPQLADEEFHLADALGQRRIPATVVFDGGQRVLFTGEALDERATAALGRALGSVPGEPGAPRCAWP